MSELKAYAVALKTDKGTQVMTPCQAVYLKSEADKVIARHKYKRCLDQVENCRTSSVYFFRISEGEKDEGKAAEYRRVSDWFDKWEERWMELAEVFKTIGDN